MHLGHRLLVPLLGLVLALGLASPAGAQELEPTTLKLAGEPDYAGAETPVQVALHHKDGSPVADAQVLVERRRSDVWSEVTVVTTDGRGEATLHATLARDAADNVFRATYAGGPSEAGSESGNVRVDLLRRNSHLTVSGPDHVVDEKTVPVKVQWMTGKGQPVAGLVRLYRRNGRGDWQLERRLRTGGDGRAKVTVRPRVDTRWRALARAQDWVQGDASNVHAVDNLPPGIPVDLPAGAPRPRINLPDQPHAVGAGANPRVTRIPNRVWQQMTGRTWHRGCPVGRPALRYLRINYWDYRGYRRRGELVANADAVHQMSAALAEMYRKELPIRAMYRVDRFGWSKRLRGGDDYKSMAAGNTSAFNCRQVVGSPGTRSPHAWGRSIDVNTWENPYRSREGTVPNSWWMGHSHPRVAWRSRSHAVVQVTASHGLRWTYGTGDTQHFDAGGGNGRMSTAFEWCGGICD